MLWFYELFTTVVKTYFCFNFDEKDFIMYLPQRSFEGTFVTATAQNAVKVSSTTTKASCFFSSP